jgi:hypothetical protein
MIAVIGVAGADDTKIVDALPHLGENLAYFEPALTISAERKRRTHEVAGGAVRLDFWAGHRLAVMLVKKRLGIERVHLRPAAIHKEKDHPLDPSREMRRFHPQRPLARGAERVRERQHSETIAHQPKNVTPVHPASCLSSSNSLR